MSAEAIQFHLVFIYNFICVSSTNELSSTVSHWEQSIGDWAYYTFDDTTSVSDSFAQTFDNNTYAELFQMDKQYYNFDHVLKINYTFSMYYDGSDYHYGGIRIYNSIIASYCEWYFIGFGVLPSGDDPDTFKGIILSRGNAPNGQQSWLKLEPYNYSIIENREYILYIKVTNNTAFDICVTDEQNAFKVCTSYIDKNGFSTLTNGYSGYISLYCSPFVSITAKYLSVSGTSRNVSTFLDPSSNCSFSLSPSLLYILQASAKSTSSPSIVTTSYNYTMNPSIEPTIEITSYSTVMTPTQGTSSTTTRKSAANQDIMSIIKSMQLVYIYVAIAVFVAIVCITICIILRLRSSKKKDENERQMQKMMDAMEEKANPKMNVSKPEDPENVHLITELQNV